MTHLGTCTHGLPEPAPSAVTRRTSSIWVSKCRGRHPGGPPADPGTRLAMS